MAPAVLRGTTIGSTLGILPGGGALLAAFAAYTIEKKIKLKPGEVAFGKGNIRGVAGPESANNAGAQTSFIPLLTLGIPPNAVMALMVGAMTIHNIQPGPQVMTSNPQLFWGLIASMWIGNLMLIILNLPLIGMWIKLLTIPYRWLFPAIVLFCAIGVYSTNNNTCYSHTFDNWPQTATLPSGRCDDVAYTSNSSGNSTASWKEEENSDGMTNGTTESNVYLYLTPDGQSEFKFAQTMLTLSGWE